MSGDRVFARISAFIHRNPRPAAATAGAGRERTGRDRRWRVINQAPSGVWANVIDDAATPVKAAMVNPPTVASRRWSAS